jgi:hypothetical protein
MPFATTKSVNSKENKNSPKTQSLIYSSTPSCLSSCSPFSELLYQTSVFGILWNNVKQKCPWKQISHKTEIIFHDIDIENVVQSTTVLIRVNFDQTFSSGVCVFSSE